VHMIFLIDYLSHFIVNLCLFWYYLHKMKLLTNLNPFKLSFRRKCSSTFEHFVWFHQVRDVTNGNTCSMKDTEGNYISSKDFQAIIRASIEKKRRRRILPNGINTTSFLWIGSDKNTAISVDLFFTNRKWIICHTWYFLC
jgi:hypothetical protein